MSELNFLVSPDSVRIKSSMFVSKFFEQAKQKDGKGVKPKLGTHKTRNRMKRVYNQEVQGKH